MAAPDAKNSPSDKDVKVQPGTAESVDASDEPGKLAAPATPPPMVHLTYATSEESEKYVVAKTLLGEGDFEQALEILEEVNVWFLVRCAVHA